MKKHFLIPALFLTATILFGQEEKDKWRYFANFDTTKKGIISRNWTQYFKEDIFDKLSGVDYYGIKFDSYGSPYPNMSLFSNVTEDFFCGGIKEDNDTRKYSMHSIFTSTVNVALISNNIKLIRNKDEQDKYKELIKNPKIGVEEFYDKYDPIHFDKLKDELEQKLKGKEKVIFFVHGYNVPYSLANVQAIAMMKILTDTFKVDISKVLLVPVFWPSNDAKICSIEDSSSFSTANMEDIKNGTKFLYYSNRAYYAALGLRKVLNKVRFGNTEILIFCHSLGAALGTTAFINTTEKLDTWLNPKILSQSCNTHTVENDKFLLKKADPITYDLVTTMAKIDLPTQAIRVFLSAAAIPGLSTFIDVEECVMKEKKFYVTINPEDEMLTKSKVSGKSFFLSGINATNASATTLGCNYDNDAFYTQIRYPYPENFQLQVVSEFEDHEIFTYMNQKLYRTFLKKWFDNK